MIIVQKCISDKLYDVSMIAKKYSLNCCEPTCQNYNGRSTCYGDDGCDPVMTCGCVTDNTCSCINKSNDECFDSW